METKGPNSSKLLSIMLTLQVPLVIASTILLSVIGFKLQPMLARYQQVKIDINTKQMELETLQKKAEEARADLENTQRSRQAALEQIQEDLKRSGNQSLQAQVNTAALAGFTIGIYYLETDSQLAGRAHFLQDALKRTGLPVEVKLYPKSDSFLKTLALPRSDEVRYEEAYEKFQADALLATLKRIDSSQSYTLRTVLNRTPNFITIFLKSQLEQTQ